MQHLRDSGDPKLTIEPNKHTNRFVDSALTVYPDLKSQNAIFMTLGKVATYTALNRI